MTTSEEKFRRTAVADRRGSGPPEGGAPTRSCPRLLFPVLAGAALLCGCQTTTQSLFNAGGPGWHVQQGQAMWRPKGGLPEIGGDLIFASNAAGQHFIQFDKTPISLMLAETTSNRWLIKFPQQNRSFGGRGAGSTHFAWLYLPRALAGQALPKDVQFKRRPDGGWRLENARTGETLEGFLAP